jgi:hypothetical protein
VSLGVGGKQSTRKGARTACTCTLLEAATAADPDPRPVQAEEHELKQVGVRGVAILATRESVSTELASWGVAAPLNELLRVVRC